MAINIKDFAAKYSLDSKDLIKHLVKAGMEVPDDSVELTTDQMNILKDQVAQKQSRGTLRLKLGVKKEDPKEGVAYKNQEEKKESLKPQTVDLEVAADKKSKTYQSDADVIRSRLAVKASKSVKNPVVKAEEVDSGKAKKVKSSVKDNIKTKKQKEEDMADRLAAKSLEQHKAKLSQKFEIPAEPVAREVRLGEMISIVDLSNQLAVKATAIVMQLMKMGVMVTVNQSIDQETAVLLVEELGHKYIIVRNEEEELELLAAQNSEPSQVRAPIVTVMGHVDHGKTTLLDKIRKSSVVDGEAGGITQSIGAYLVKTKKGNVAFLDTPGHEAFTAMRARGAQCTDIVVLIVAADDGVMPQTIEAIQHAKAAKVPIVVAVNKMDKEGADPERVKSELAGHDVIAESWGGDILFQEVSAKTGLGVDALLEHLALQAEMLELKAPATGMASGTVIEAVLDKGFGAVATLMVQSGCLKLGDIVLIGAEYGRVRSIVDSQNQKIKIAGPSTPVKITGLSGVPSAGENFRVMDSEKSARDYSRLRKQKSRDKKMLQTKVKPLDQMFEEAKTGEQEIVLNIVLKADTHGAVEALSESVKKLSNEQITIKVIGSGVGMINETDVNLALASSAMVVGFNVRADFGANKLLQSSGIDPFYCSVIYDLIEKIKAQVKGMEEPVFVEEVVGKVDVREVFRSSKFGVVAGCMVTHGFVKKNICVRVLRDGVVIHQGIVNSLRRSKDDVTEVKAGIECGIGVKDYTDMRSGDELEVYINKKQ